VLRQLGVYIFPFGDPQPTVESTVAMAEFVEDLGFDSVHMPWHHTAATQSASGNRFFIDPMVVLPMIVARTSRVRVGLSSAVIPALHPFVWAHYLASLDVASGGRVIAGAAVGWWEEDLRIGGCPTKERGKRTDEALDIMTRLWSGREIDAAGAYWDATGLKLDPLPAQEPLPLWVGGVAAPR
jgi:alkanesulfonate monooxygenase SsuD/methylene tetrahydromethanopterin reductase-like flavin-dependent oxidoreductase (luciferase family)